MRVTAGTKTRRTRLNNERDTIETESKATKKRNLAPMTPLCTCITSAFSQESQINHLISY